MAINAELLDAIRSFDDKKVNKILKSFPEGTLKDEVNALDEKTGNSLLLMALEGQPFDDDKEKEFKIIKALINAGADVHFKDSKYGWHALFLAAKRTNPKFVTLLLEKGVPVDLKTNHGYTALIVAHTVDYCVNQETIAVLIKNGANVNALNKHGETALFHAVRNYKTHENIKAIETLIKSNANVNVINEKKETPLLWAIKLRFFDVINVLVKAGAKIDGVNDNNENALIEICNRKDYKALIGFLGNYEKSKIAGPVTALPDEVIEIKSPAVLEDEKRANKSRAQIDDVIEIMPQNKTRQEAIPADSADEKPSAAPHIEKVTEEIKPAVCKKPLSPFLIGIGAFTAILGNIITLVAAGLCYWQLKKKAFAAMLAKGEKFSDSHPPEKIQTINDCIFRGIDVIEIKNTGHFWLFCSTWGARGLPEYQCIITDNPNTPRKKLR